VSYSKRVLFGNDPEDEPVRAKLQEQAEALLRSFTFKIPMRRENRLPGPHWDSRWPLVLQCAVDELSIATIKVNDQLCARSEAEAKIIKKRAEELYNGFLQEDVRIPAKL
jgi:hypothetical protein